ncbi:MAG: ribonuclease Z [Candidatus Micrarchaeota archaeon]
MMDITILGCAASAPTTARNLPSTAVRIGGDILLLDCGEGTQRQMMRYGLSYAKVKAIFVSHLHLDHFLGIFGLGETLRLSGAADKIDIFGPRGIERFLYSFGRREIFHVHEISKKDFSKPIFTINGHDVSAFEVSHGKTDAFGYCIKERDKIRFYEKKAKAAGIDGPLFSQIAKEGKIQIGQKTILLRQVSYAQKGKCICYSGDTQYCKNTARAAKGCDLLIHEATFDESRSALAKEKFHSTSSDAAKIAKEAGAKRLLLTHIGGKYTKEEKLLLEGAKKIFKNSSVAKDGLKIGIK